MSCARLATARRDDRLRIGALASTVVVAWALVLLIHAPVAADAQTEPSVLHGVGQVVGGVLFELPKTVLEATFENPPVLGTVVGLLAGTARAFQTTFAGLREIGTSFDPWGAKKR